MRKKRTARPKKHAPICHAPYHDPEFDPPLFQPPEFPPQSQLPELEPEFPPQFQLPELEPEFPPQSQLPELEPEFPPQSQLPELEPELEPLLLPLFQPPPQSELPDDPPPPPGTITGPGLTHGPLPPRLPPPKGFASVQQPITKKTRLRMNQMRARCKRLFTASSSPFSFPHYLCTCVAAQKLRCSSFIGPPFFPPDKGRSAGLRARPRWSPPGGARGWRPGWLRWSGRG